MFGQMPLKYRILPQILSEGSPYHVGKNAPVCKINLPSLVVSHLDLSFLLRFNTNRVREVVMSRESISFIMIVIELQKCFVFDSYHTNIYQDNRQLPSSWCGFLAPECLLFISILLLNSDMTANNTTTRT